ncbi:MAG: 1-deoxy-D-xylulose-5-phosphate reductoisomerase [Candidatus Zixiibacteriota bacterium]
MFDKGKSKKNIALLGSAGSIGQQSLDVIEQLSDEFQLYSIASYDEIEILKEQIEKYKPQKVALSDRKAAEKLAASTDSIDIKGGMENVIAFAKDENVDIVINAIGGAAGLLPGLEAAKAGKRLASANKECFVMAGHLFREIMHDTSSDAEIIPIDSEHSALFQALLSGRYEDISRLILTASGGPFFNKDVDYDDITPEQALDHPNWSMGPRITIDSATMFNKGLEVIEARWLFDIPPKNIDVLVHPQSIIHSIVEFVDGSQIAQLSVPDMRLPIQYALTYPKRYTSPIGPLNLYENGKLEFFKVPLDRFPALRLAFESLEAGGTAPAVANAADEVAVKLFLEGKIKFSNIPRLIAKALDKHSASKENPSIDEILHTDRVVRQWLLKDLA